MEPGEESSAVSVAGVRLARGLVADHCQAGRLGKLMAAPRALPVILASAERVVQVDLLAEVAAEAAISVAAVVAPILIVVV